MKRGVLRPALRVAAPLLLGAGLLAALLAGRRLAEVSGRLERKSREAAALAGHAARRSLERQAVEAHHRMRAWDATL